MGWALALVALVAILALDAYLVARKRKSMSRWLIEASRNRLWVPFLFGLGMGALAAHLFWQLESCMETLR